LLFHQDDDTGVEEEEEEKEELLIDGSGSCSLSPVAKWVACRFSRIDWASPNSVKNNKRKRKTSQMRQGVDFKWYVYHVCSLQSLFLLVYILVVQSNVQDASYLITPAQCLGLLRLDPHQLCGTSMPLLLLQQLSFLKFLYLQQQTGMQNIGNQKQWECQCIGYLYKKEVCFFFCTLFASISQAVSATLQLLDYLVRNAKLAVKRGGGLFCQQQVGP
jgi:hypothetical protein